MENSRGDRCASAALTEGGAFRGRGGVRDQIDRAAVSISNNIAEGFEAGTSNKLIAYLYHAKGSAGETRSMLRLLSRLPSISNLKSEISDFKSGISDLKSEISGLIKLCESASRQLGGWCQQLQNTDIAGPRHLTEEVRSDTTRKAQVEALLAELKRHTSHLPRNDGAAL